MAVHNSKKHLAMVKANAKKVGSEPVSFFLVCRKGSKDGVLHIDARKDRSARYKNPAVIHKLLLANKALGYGKDDPFFGSLSELISSAGTVTFDGERFLLSPTIRSGKGKPADIKKVLTSSGFKFLKGYAFATGSDTITDDAVLDAAPVSPEVEALLSGDTPPSAAELYAAMGSIDDMYGAIDRIREQLAATSDPDARDALSTLLGQLDALYASVEEWTLDDDFDTTVADLTEGLGELSSTTYDEAALELCADTAAYLQEAWKAFSGRLDERMGKANARIVSFGEQLASAKADTGHAHHDSAAVFSDPVLKAMSGCDLAVLKDRLFADTLKPLEKSLKSIDPELGEKAALGGLGKTIAQLDAMFDTVLLRPELMAFDEIMPSVRIVTLAADCFDDLSDRLASLSART